MLIHQFEFGVAKFFELADYVAVAIRFNRNMLRKIVRIQRTHTKAVITFYVHLHEVRNAVFRQNRRKRNTTHRNFMARPIAFGPLLAERTLQIVGLIDPKGQSSFLFGNPNVEDRESPIRDFFAKLLLCCCNQNRIGIDRNHAEAFMQVIGRVRTVVQSYVVDEVGNHAKAKGEISDLLFEKDLISCRHRMLLEFPVIVIGEIGAVVGPTALFARERRPGHEGSDELQIASFKLAPAVRCL